MHLLRLCLIERLDLPGQKSEDVHNRQIPPKIVFDRGFRHQLPTPPPPLDNDDERHPRFEIRYASVSDLPASESLKDTLLRVKPYWQTQIIPSLLGNQDVLIVAHGNSLRAMVKMIENISDKEIMNFNIPTGIPLAYEFNENLKPIKQGFIGDPETIKQAAQAVANQGLV